MNNILNIKRLGLVFRKDILEGWKRYMLLFLTMLGIITVMLTWNYWDHYRDIEIVGEHNVNPNTNRVLLAYLSLMFGGFGLIFASTFASPMNSKLKKITYLLSPSSNFEKYFTRWVIVTVVYTISFFIAMWAADMIRVAICSVRFPDLNIMFVDLTKLVYMGNESGTGDCLLSIDIFILLVNLYFLFQSLFILGATFWAKSAFVKTFTAVALIIILYVLICRWAILLFYGDFDTFGNVLNSFESIIKTNMNEKTTSIIASSVISFFTLANWTLAFFRFRESEITKRL